MASEQLSPRPDLLRGRAETVASETESKVRELLGRHKDLVAEGVTEQIVAREVSRARDEYAAKRLEGHANDNYSKTPGITIYMTGTAKEALAKVFEEGGYPVSDEQWKPLPNSVWEISFLTGTYGMGLGGCQFYQEADDDFYKGGRDKVRKPFSTPYDSIVRVEGKSGELWQNVNYAWDGVPKSR